MSRHKLIINRTLFDTIVHVKVGKDAKVFALHRGLLCDSSAYFRVAFEGNFIEAQEQALLLPEDDVEVYELFQFWLYSGKLLDTGESIADLKPGLLVDLYIFAETRCILQLQDLTMDALINHVHETQMFPIGKISYVYGSTTETSPLRRLFVDVFALRGEESWISEEKSYLSNRTSVIDLVRAFYNMRSTKESVLDFAGTGCKYHAHTEAEGCYISQKKR